MSNGPGGRALPAWREVPFADGHGRVAGVAEQAGEGGGRLRQAGVVARVGPGDVGQEAHPDGVVVAPGEERGPGGRAQGGDVEAVEGGAAAGQPVEVRGGDVGAEDPEVAEAGVVEHDGHDVGCAGRRLGIDGPAGCRLRRGEADLLRGFDRAHRAGQMSARKGMATG